MRLDKKKATETALKIQKVHDRGLKQLDDIFEMMLEEAKGTMFVVAPHEQRPRSAEPMGKGKTVGPETCASCGQLIPKEPIEVWEVFRKPRDSQMLKYLHDQLAGKAAQKAQEEIDYNIEVIFPNIACLPSSNNASDSPDDDPDPEVGLEQ